VLYAPTKRSRILSQLEQQDNHDDLFLLWVLIAQTRDAISKARHRELERWNINKERRAILWNLANNGGVSTPIKIARELFKEINSVSEMLKRMEEQGLVIRGKRKGKASLPVYLTPKGEEILNQSRNNEIDKRIFSVLSEEQRNNLISSLWSLRSQALKELGIPDWRIAFPLPDAIINSNNDSKGIA